MHLFFRHRSIRAFVAWSTCFSLGLPSAAIAGDGPFRLVDWQPTGTPVEELAHQIDKLEKRIDQDGSIVIKTPDVWGESRLMRHRSDVETQLKARLGAFDFRINGVQATRDAAFLATAVAIQEEIAATGNVPALGPVPATTGPAVSNAVSGLIGNPNDLSTAANAVLVPRRDFLTPTVVTGTTNRALTIGIEPVIELDQMNRYLQHLNELRRLNEGDDNSDTPGYALNLIRIPVSVLPGRRTEQGFGAEVQITIDPYMSDEILPMAFKDFVINGVVDRISFDVFQIAKREDINALSERVQQFGKVTLPPQSEANPRQLVRTPKPVDYSSATSENKAKQEEAFNAIPTDSLKVLDSKLNDPAGSYNVEFKSEFEAIHGVKLPEIDDHPGRMAAAAAAQEIGRRRLLSDINHRDISIASSQRDRINGDTLDEIALHTYNCLVERGSSTEDVEPELRVNRGLTMPEVTTLLSEETKNAYDFLLQPSAAYLWEEYCTPELARKIREHRHSANPESPHVDSIEFVRKTFFDQLFYARPDAHVTVTDVLAWQIIVESALMNDRLITDMRETATLKNCPCIPMDCMSFFGPNPPPEAHEAFRQYVKCKWPIHVFALDPVTQDQNISDSFSQRREMQMAMAIAASGRILGGQAMQRFVRRMEYDLETIQLNRTAVAFSHGDNTFGWRFFPRVQAPPVPSNLSAITHDLLIGGQNSSQLLNSRRLEPGIRECTALVVMPSFVPQVMVDVRTDWFRLAKHVPFYPFNKRKPDHEDSMELSKQLTDLRCLQTQCMNDAHKYRDGDVYRLCKAVERLEERLPMQTHNVSVPWENDLGGFEVFQSGTQVLGPEIHGWYGAPGIVAPTSNAGRNAILVTLSQAVQASAETALALQLVPVGTQFDPERATKKAAFDAAKLNEATARATYAAFIASQTDTAIFLVGKNFSVLNCRVIAGGVDVTNTIEVINRNLMQVRIPSTVSTVATSHSGGVDQKSVVVHLATPYGATSRLLIPVAGDQEVADSRKALEAAEKAVSAANAAKNAADAAGAAAKNAELKAQNVSERNPTALEWQTEGQQKEFDVAWGADTKVCPTDEGEFELTIADQRPTFRLKDAHLKDVDPPQNIDGLLYLNITSPGLKSIACEYSEVTVADGSPTLMKETAPIKVKQLLDKVMNVFKGQLTCDGETTVVIAVQGGVRLDGSKTITPFQDRIIFNLKPVPKK